MLLVVAAVTSRCSALQSPLGTIIVNHRNSEWFVNPRELSKTVQLFVDQVLDSRQMPVNVMSER